LANPAGTIECPLSLFSSLDTELSPPDLPEGISPANNDVVFTPGAVATRWGMNKTLTPFDAGPWTYQKSFKSANGNVKNLYMSQSSGNLYVVDVTNSPGSLSLLWASAGASYASSVTANNSEYIALSDGVHGVDIPLQYDGTNLWRITQDGPGAPPTVTSLALPAVSMVASGNTLTRMNNTVTAITAAPHGLQVGYQAQISNVPDSNATSVNQTSTTGSATVNSSVWGFASGNYRSLFNPGTSALSDFVITGFGFSIPGTATILGVIVSFESWLQNASSATVADVALRYSGSTEGTPKSPATTLTTTPTVNSYGSAGDLWGAALTPAIVNDPSFGFAFDETLSTSRSFVEPLFTVQVYYTLSGSGTIADIASIVINNETFPGLALVTTTTAHGLIPNIFVSIVGVEPGTVANVSAGQWSSGVTTLTTSTNHNLNPGAVVQVTGVTTATGSTTFSFNGTFTVESVPSPIQVVYFQTPITALDPDLINATASTGAITVAWPIPQNTPTPTYFQVQTCPTSTTFYIEITYSDATWTTGTVGFIWEGIFFVTAILSATSFQYQQYGPNGATTAMGTVTPWGQAAPGIHLCQLSFLLFNGTITPPSPPVQFIANGGQYLQVSNIATGPASVAGRILQFTGAGGAFYFYIPVPAKVNGITVSTATQINDNTTTSIVLDFSDNTLYGTGAAGNATGTACSVPGNNLAAGNILGPSAGLFTYAQRLLAWGNRNKANGFLNMGFDGGVNGLGWTPIGGGITTIAGRLGFLGEFAIPNTSTDVGVEQLCFNAAGAALVEANTLYIFRAWFRAVPVVAGNIVAEFSSVSTGFTSFANVPTGTMLNTVQGSFLQANFSLATPDTIPPDFMLSIYGVGTNNTTVYVDDIEIFPVAQPYNQNEAWISYSGNFGGFDGITGLIGPEDDVSPIMNFGVLRRTLYFITGTGLHETQDNGETEPDSWEVDEVADNCGAFSISSVARNPQGIGSAGKTWLIWNGPDGAQLFAGQLPYKISQEIQSFWDQIPQANAYQCWVKNYEARKWCFFGIPLAAGGMTTLVLDYRNLDGEAIAFNPPIHISFTGKMIASDLTRKWTQWMLNAWSGELLYQTGNITPQIALGIQNPSAQAQSYILNQNQFFDDDFGITLLQNASYTTYFFVSHEMEQGLQVGSHRKIYSLASAFIAGIGNWFLTPNAAALGNMVPQTYGPWPLQANPGSDSPFGVNVTTTRCAFTIQAQPVQGGTSVYFKLQKMVINMAPDQQMPIGQIGASY
jgi:hypothetical protein